MGYRDDTENSVEHAQDLSVQSEFLPEVLAPIPVSFPAQDGSSLARRRAVFSTSIFNIDTHHATRNVNRFASQHDRRRYVDDYSLKLIDDLINRPVDTLFMDSRLGRQEVGVVSRWITRIVVFIICIAIGTVGSQFVRRLHTDPRKAIRNSLANELVEHTNRFDSLVQEVSSLKNSVNKESQRMITPEEDKLVQSDDITNGTRAVSGSGVVITIANPMVATSDAVVSTLPREAKGAKVRVITDRDIQIFVSILWNAGAEAISVNGHRLGAQTSIRTAGQTVLVGVNQTQSPYVIEAIGNRDNIIRKLDEAKLSPWYASLTNAGMNPQITTSDMIKLSAAGTGDLKFAKEK